MNDHTLPTTVLHWNYRGFTEFPLKKLDGEEAEITDIYLKENLISNLPPDIGKLVHLESLYLSGNDITELPREISRLRHLKCLDVSGNRLRHIPDEIGEVIGLKILILDENELSELPLRLAELRSLRYLSVCDNRLLWLPQRPVYNYYHCEFRFWRNISLKCIPYSLWYHMFREQQTRSLNIGCLAIPNHTQESSPSRCSIKLWHESRGCEINVGYPQYNTILRYDKLSPASLYELSKRVLYNIVSEEIRKLTKEMNSSYSYSHYNLTNEYNFNGVNNGDSSCIDENANSVTCTKIENGIKRRPYDIHKNTKEYVATDMVKEYFDFLPIHLKRELSNGPMSNCENSNCKKAIFDYVIYEFCIGDIILIDKIEEIILSAVFCSKTCAEIWKKGKKILTWTLHVA